MSYNLDKKREEFRKYLEGAGAIDNLTTAFVKLYEQKNKPQDAIKFLRKQMCSDCHDEEQFELLENDLKEANAKICQLEREISRLKGEVKRTASEIDLSLKKGFESIVAAKDSPMILKQILKKNMMEESKGIKTKFGGTLLDCIQSGLEQVRSPVGVFASDPEAYSLFDFVFNPLLEIIHKFRKNDKQPVQSWGEACKLPELDPKYAKSVRISCRRNVLDFPFAPLMNMNQYEEIFDKIACAAKCLCGSDLKGKLYPLEGTSEEDRKILIKNGLMFSNDNEEFKAANGYRYWPTGRAVFANEKKNFSIWCNQQDHLKFIGIDVNGNLRSAYDTLINGVTQVSKDIPMVHDERLGFLTCSPLNLGNTICVSVRINLEKLPLQKDKLDEIIKKFKLKVRKLSIEECEDSDFMYEVTSERCMGVSEFKTVEEAGDAIVAMIDAEKSL